MSNLDEFHGRVLIIEDNKDIASLLLDFFADKGHVTDYAADGLTGLHLVTVNDYDVVLLDLALPGIDGIELCKKIRTQLQSNTPILMLTARDSIDEKLIGFDAGADDYLVKPFDLLEVYARVQALWRRSFNISQSTVQVADLVFDTEKVTLMRGDQLIKLNAVRLKILKLLMDNSQRVVSRSEIEAHVWGDDLTESDALRTHLSAIRQAIDKPFELKLLHTIHSVGYRLYDESKV